MKKHNKELYEHPTTVVVELSFEGIICGSEDSQGSADMTGMDNPEDI